MNLPEPGEKVQYWTRKAGGRPELVNAEVLQVKPPAWVYIKITSTDEEREIDPKRLIRFNKPPVVEKPEKPLDPVRMERLFQSLQIQRRYAKPFPGR